MGESEAADELLRKLRSIAANSPQSCSDWVREDFNSNEQCLALVYTDMGVIMRARPRPNLERAEYFYNEALKQQPTWCGAESYLTELRIQQDNELAAAEQFGKACLACGSSKVDMVEVKIAFAEKGWQLPADGCNAPLTPVPTFATGSNQAVTAVPIPSSFTKISGAGMHRPVLTVVMLIAMLLV